ncbi:uncharacterized protein MONOS_6626 [Monocercomonoides exilis]|uniref:uncharacterized protein n=1 Tax=Monocercomonoides exilis TaxID=2049356 RepID=UPI00355A4FED|nr:hypothetical protein MONOS_6626 [Monocercomonoides exilis]|eukprot:MONOS_6626.1-p1 / transcript=MONOS_6626.1 / gene=MONOS_6626 / organism=Monocercomonoides_exilis_PA203 / gene_product=unspecified product / transcript_product=unspecified product / location=Mono_scaffold00212:15882-16306(-) / protein_length=124 / sequence_SO=supercontig / SO=protein_coding / is_pseudo=false
MLCLLGVATEAKGQLRQTKQMERDERLSGRMAMSMVHTAGAEDEQAGAMPRRAFQMIHSFSVDVQLSTKKLLNMETENKHFDFGSVSFGSFEDGGGGGVEEEEEIAPIAKFQKDEHSKEERKI